jgi:hypothetical protein
LTPEYSIAAIERYLHAAVADLYRTEPDLDDFSSETDQTEWNLTAHLAPHIVRYFKGYSYDVDVAKVNLGNKRPDIIIHKRGPDTKNNLLVIEVKRKRSRTAVRSDAEKIREYWFSERLHYRFGATINLWADRHPDIEVFSNESSRIRSI